VFIIEFAGHLTIELAANLMSDTNRRLAHYSPIYIFNDWWEMKSYDTKARMELTAWAQRIRPRLLGVHLLVRSKLVAMGVSVANIALGSFLLAHAERPDFEAALKRAMSEA
jgi:hypothetical protein